MKAVKGSRFLLYVLFCLLLTAVAFYLISALSDEAPQGSSRSDGSRGFGPSDSSESAGASQSSGGEASGKEAPASEDMEINGVWIASVGNIDFPSKQGLGADALKAELDDIVDTVKRLGLNTVIFQVRPTSDALYKSDIFPVSEYLTGTQGSGLPGGFDPLAYLIERAHQNGIYVHAWINPYRITSGTKSSPKHDVNALSENNPARRHPEWVVPYADGKLYYNPGLPQVRELVTEGVMEIVRRYEVDGIHFDDYFYPYPVAGAQFDDSKAYQQYGKGKTLEEFRCDNVNALIKGVYQAIKAERPSVLFGVSPFGIWANASTNPLGSDTNGFQSYVAQYADSYTWVKNGWLDYITPQIYWSMEYQPAQFDKLCDWWSETVRGTSVRFVPGHAAYKAGDKEQIAVDSAWAEPDELVRQINYARHKNGYAGSLFYGYKTIKNNVLGLFDSLSSYYASASRVASFPARGIILADPQDSETRADHIHVFGAAPPGKPLKINGAVTQTDENGFFSAYLPLSLGENKFMFTCEGETVTRTVRRLAPETKKELIQRDSVFPQSGAVYYGRPSLWFCARAPQGSEVSVTAGGHTILLKHRGGGLYTGELEVPTAEKDRITLDVVFTAVKDGVTDTVAVDGITIYPGASGTAVVTADRTRLFAAPAGEAHDDAGMLPRGVTDDVEAFDEKHIRLACGYLIKKEDAALSSPDNGSAHKPVNRVLGGSLKLDGDKTVLTLKTTLPVPFLFSATDDYFSVSLCYTDEEYVQYMAISKNPLFSRVQRFSLGGRTEYRLYCAAKGGFYGWDARYDNGALKVMFKNAPPYAAGNTPLSGSVIAIDPGHGQNRGAVGPLWHYGPVEDDLNLDMALRIGNALEKLGAKVVFTRENARTWHAPRDIPDIFCKASPDLALSIHFNSMERDVDGSLYEGSIAFYSTLWSQNAAETLLQAIGELTGRPVIGVSRASYAVTLAQGFPSVLLELGFMNNIREYGWYLNAENRQKIADAVAEGVRRHLSPAH